MPFTVVADNVHLSGPLATAAFHRLPGTKTRTQDQLRHNFQAHIPSSSSMDGTNTPGPLNQGADHEANNSHGSMASMFRSVMHWTARIFQSVFGRTGGLDDTPQIPPRLKDEFQRLYQRWEARITADRQERALQDPEADRAQRRRLLDKTLPFPQQQRPCPSERGCSTPDVRHESPARSWVDEGRIDS